MEFLRKHNRTINILLVVAIIAVGIIVSLTRGSSPSGDYNYDKDTRTMTFTAPDGYSLSFSLNNVTSVDFLESFDPGTAVSGKTENGYTFGVWQNDSLGTFELLKLTNVSSVVAVRTESGGVYVFNAESADTTRAFYETIQKELAAE